MPRSRRSRRSRLGRGASAALAFALLGSAALAADSLAQDGASRARIYTPPEERPSQFNLEIPTPIPGFEIEIPIDPTPGFDVPCVSPVGVGPGCGDADSGQPPDGTSCYGPRGETLCADPAPPTQPGTCVPGRDNGCPGPVNPDTAGQVAPPSGAGDGIADDPADTFSRENGAMSPTCERGGALDVELRENCNGSGTLAHRYPIGNYLFDFHISTGLFAGVVGNGLALVSMLGTGLWLALLYIVKGVTLALEWTFELPVLVQAGDDAPLERIMRSVAGFHERVIGRPWTLAAIAIAGLWGIWNGLVRRRTIQTFAGLAATVALMVVALVVIARPGETVGRAAILADEAALTVLAAATFTEDLGDGGDGVPNGEQGVQALGPDPHAGYGRALSGLFGRLVRDPWCMLQFGSTTACSQPASELPADALAGDVEELDGDGGVETVVEGGGTIADLFLRYEPCTGCKGKDSDDPGAERNILYQQFRKAEEPIGDGARSPRELVKIQNGPSALLRMAMLVLVAIGLLGAIFTLSWIALNLLRQSILAVLLLLATPFMFVIAAFGETGRQTFYSWGKRLFVAVIGKLLFALLLTIVLAGSALMAYAIGPAGWVPAWIVQTIYWWGIFGRREEILGWFTAGSPDRGVAESAGNAAQQTLATVGAVRLARDVARAPYRATFGRHHHSGHRTGGLVGRAGAVSRHVDGKAMRGLEYENSRGEHELERGEHARRVAAAGGVLERRVQAEAAKQRLDHQADTAIAETVARARRDREDMAAVGRLREREGEWERRGRDAASADGGAYWLGAAAGAAVSASAIEARLKPDSAEFKQRAELASEYERRERAGQAPISGEMRRAMVAGIESRQARFAESGSVSPRPSEAELRLAGIDPERVERDGLSARDRTRLVEAADEQRALVAQAKAEPPAPEVARAQQTLERPPPLWRPPRGDTRAAPRAARRLQRERQRELAAHAGLERQPRPPEEAR